MKITLYQIVPELDNDHLMFCDLRFIQTAGYDKVPAEIYESVYHGDLDIKTPEDAFYVFNMAHPEVYKGRSMSVSDVIQFPDSSGGKQFYFCGTVGFQKIEFDDKKAMLPIVNHDLKQEETIRCGNFDIIFCSGQGVQKLHCSKVVLTRCRYSQCQLGYRLRYWHFGENHWKEEDFTSRPAVLLVSTGFRSIPDSLFYEESEDGLRKQKYAAFSNENLKAVEQWCQTHTIKYEYL